MITKAKVFAKRERERERERERIPLQPLEPDYLSVLIRVPSAPA